jgi:hypothetical protein
MTKKALKRAILETLDNSGIFSHILFFRSIASELVRLYQPAGEAKLKRVRRSIWKSDPKIFSSTDDDGIRLEFDAAVEKLVSKKKISLVGKTIKLEVQPESNIDPTEEIGIKSPCNNNEPSGNCTILLFYAYCTRLMTIGARESAISFCYRVLQENSITGRLRVAREGYNATLTGSFDAIRKFTDALRIFDPSTFGSTDFKYVDFLPDNKFLKGLKVWAVQEIVTYGFQPEDAPLDKSGVHLNPSEFHSALEDPNAVVIDVRNFNETVIGKFSSPVAEVLDPCMRKSTEFPKWVEQNISKLKDKKVLMYCTGKITKYISL